MPALISVHASVKFRLVLCLVVLLLIAAQLFVSFGNNSYLFRAIQNSAHLPWSLVLTLCIWLVFHSFGDRYHKQAMLIALFLGCLWAVFSEVVQLLNSRDASTRDIFLNLLGVGGAGLVLKGSGYLKDRARFKAALCFIGVVVLLLFASSEVLSILRSQYLRDLKQPVIISFEAEDEHLLRQLRADWELVPENHNISTEIQAKMARIGISFFIVLVFFKLNILKALNN